MTTCSSGVRAAGQLALSFLAALVLTACGSSSGGGISLTATATSPIGVSLSWSAPQSTQQVTRHVITRDGLPYLSVSGRTHSLKVTVAKPETRVSYQVRAQAGGFPFGYWNVATSNVASVTTLPNVPPTVPQDLRATAVSPARVDLLWSPSGDDMAVVGYRIHVAGTEVTSSQGPSAVLADLDPAQEHCFTVTAYDIFDATSAPSATACATTPPDITPPQAPEMFRATYAGGGQVQLTWSPAQDDGVVRGYELFRDSAYLGTAPAAPELSWLDSGVQPHTGYAYAVRAFDAGGNFSPLKTASVATSWRSTAIDTTHGYVHWTASALDPVGRLHVAYRIDAFFYGMPGYDEEIRYWTAGMHSTLGTASRNSCDLVVGPDYSAHLAFGTWSDLFYATAPSGSWLVGAVGAGSYAANPSILLTAGGRVMLSFRQGGLVRLAEFANPVWQISDVDATYPGSGPVFATSAALDSTGAVHVAYMGPGESVRHAVRAPAGTWSIDVVDPGPGVGEYVSMAVDPQDGVHLTYYDRANGDLRYACNASGSWQSIVLDSEGDVGSCSSMTLDLAGAVHVGYIAEPDYDLKYATNASGSWQLFTIDSESKVRYGRTSITAAADGTVRIVYVTDRSGMRVAANDAQ